MRGGGGGGAYNWAEKAFQNKLHTPTVVGLIKIRYEFTVAFLKLQSILKDQILLQCNFNTS